MTKVILVVAVVVALIVAVGGIGVYTDYSATRKDLDSISFGLGDAENVLRSGRPDPSSVQTTRLRVDHLRDDLRLVSVRHPVGTKLLSAQINALYERLAAAEQRLRSV